MHALRRDARGATLRDPETGLPTNGQPSPSWLGTIGYLILVEQIGTAIHRIDGRKLDPGFDRAIDHFGPSPLSLGERKGLRSLRNAFAHDYGLISRGRENSTTGKVSGRFLFALMPWRTPIIKVGPPWNLNWTANPATDATHVGVVGVANYVENMVEKVIYEHGRGNVDTDLRGGLDELGARYLFSATL